MQRTILCKWTRSLNSTYILNWYLDFILKRTHLMHSPSLFILIIIIAIVAVVHVVSFISYSLSYLFGLTLSAHTFCPCLARSFIAQTADLIQNTHLNTCSVYYFRACVCVSAYWLSNFSISFRLFHFPFFVFIFSTSSFHPHYWLHGWLALGGRCAYSNIASASVLDCLAFLISFFSSSFHIKIHNSHMHVIDCCCYLLNIKIRTNENSRRLKRLNKLSPCSLPHSLGPSVYPSRKMHYGKAKKKLIIKSSNGYSSSRKPTCTW